MRIEESLQRLLQAGFNQTNPLAVFLTMIASSSAESLAATKEVIDAELTRRKLMAGSTNRDGVEL